MVKNKVCWLKWEVIMTVRNHFLTEDRLDMVKFLFIIYSFFEELKARGFFPEIYLFYIMGLRGRTNLTGEHLFFLTTTIVEFIKVFIKDVYCDILIKNIKHYQEKYKFEILAYVIMPTHFHWLIMVNPKYGTVSDIMRDIKKYSAWDIMEILEKKNSGLMKIFNVEGSKYKNQKRKLWMPRFDDEVIRNEKMFWTKLHYIHNNPVKAGLVNVPEKYKYSSARNYINNDHSIIKVDTSFAGTEIK